MNTLKQNVINILGENSQVWLKELPATIDIFTKYWKLKHLVPVDNMTFNYVAKASSETGRALILKIGFDENSIANEILALRYFNGSGSVRLIDHHQHESYHALLLEQAVPGITLSSLYPSQAEYVMDCYVATMNKLHDKPLTPKNNYRHIRDWLKALNKLSANDCPALLIQRAITLKNELLASMTREVFLHGDLHHDNILQNGETWLAIDPKGIVGEPEFEIAAFDFMRIQELTKTPDARHLLEARINVLAKKAQLNPLRIRHWFFVRLMLMAAWFIEDNGDPRWVLALAEINLNSPTV